MSAETPLHISGISKSFNKNVLDNINFSVQQNHIFGFIGLNGQGKTTLIKIILDLLDQDMGEVEIFGKSRVLPEARTRICYLPEKFQPALYQTGFEFLGFVLSFYQRKINEIEAYKICENLDLSYQVLHEKIAKYSKGMTQKLGLLAVFLSGADLIILDEPMSGLDPLARIALKKELLDYHSKNKTIFFSSHILSDIDEICNQIGVLHASNLRYTGSPAQFKQLHQALTLDSAFLAEINS
jgi:ABC-2 type transport system ATP-binding protein